MNIPNSQKFNSQQAIYGESFEFLDFDSGEIVKTALVRNTATDTNLFISILEETAEYALVDLWEENRGFGIIPILKNEESNSVIKDGAEEITGFIWHSYQHSQSGLKILNSNRINQSERYSSKLNMIAKHATIVMTNTFAERYLLLARKDNRETAGLDGWKESGRKPEWLDRVAKAVNLLILREFDKYPEEAEAMRNDFWRSVVSVALQDLRSQGVTKDVTRRELKAILNRHIFEDEESDCVNKAVMF
jgi:hypothetical protein